MTWVLLARTCAAVTLCVALASGTSPSPAQGKRVAFIVESWYPASHADVIGARFLEGYRVGTTHYFSPVTVGSVYTNAPRPTDQTQVLAARYGFRVARTIADALVDDPAAPRPRLAVDGVLIGTREDLLRRGGEPASPTPRLQVVREVLRILDQTGSRVPVFFDKMISANWADSQAIVAEAERRAIPLMGGSVLGFMPLDRPLRSGRMDVVVAITAGPYRADAFHLAELLQSLMERRSSREVGVSGLRDVGRAYWAMPDREVWGGRVFDALLASVKTLPGGPPGSGASMEPSVLLIQYRDGARAVLAAVPRAFGEGEFRLGVRYSDGSIETSGVTLQGPPFDHFGYLVHALVALFNTGRPPVPIERTLLTTGLVLHGLNAQAAAVATPTLAISYPAPAGGP